VLASRGPEAELHTGFRNITKTLAMFAFPMGPPSLKAPPPGWHPSQNDEDTSFVFNLQELHPENEGSYGVCIARRLEVARPPALSVQDGTARGSGPRDIETEESPEPNGDGASVAAALSIAKPNRVEGGPVSKRAYMLLTRHTYFAQHYAVLRAILRLEAETTMTASEQACRMEMLLEAYLQMQLPRPGQRILFPLQEFVEGEEQLDFSCPPRSSVRTELVSAWGLPALFAAIPLSEILRVLSCLLLERSLVICGADLDTVTKVALSFPTLLHPFKWAATHRLFAVLPNPLLEALDMPVPYIAGLPGLLPLSAAPEEGTVILNLDAHKLEDFVVSNVETTPLFKYNKLYTALLPFHEELQSLAAGNRRTPASGCPTRPSVMQGGATHSPAHLIKGVMACLHLYYTTLLDFLDDQGLGLNAGIELRTQEGGVQSIKVKQGLQDMSSWSKGNGTRCSNRKEMQVLSCDECLQPLQLGQGYFRCGMCAWYHLCVRCEARRLHDPSHVFLKLYTQLSQTEMGPLLRPGLLDYSHAAESAHKKRTVAWEHLRNKVVHVSCAEDQPFFEGLLHRGTTQMLNMLQKEVSGIGSGGVHARTFDHDPRRTSGLTIAVDSPIGKGAETAPAYSDSLSSTTDTTIVAARIYGEDLSRRLYG